MGIKLSGNFSSTERSQQAVAKSNAVVASLMGAGVRAGGINPLCGINIWISFGIPAMSYGSELWNNLNGTEDEIPCFCCYISAYGLQFMVYGLQLAISMK